MADHPLRPATDHCLGRPLPHQLANPTRAPLPAINLSPMIAHRAYAVLAEVSLGYPPQEGRFPRATHPCATPLETEAPRSVRLACVKHAASVRSEPGSNSHVQSSTDPPSLNSRPADLTNPPRLATEQASRQGPSQRLQDTGSRPCPTRERRPPPPAHPFPFQQCQSTNPAETARRSGPRRNGRRLISPSPGQRQRPFDGSRRAANFAAVPLRDRLEATPAGARDDL